MKCPQCQAENPEGVKFCGECGQSLSMELTCPQCGHLEKVMDMTRRIRSQGHEAGLQQSVDISAGMASVRALVYMGSGLEAADRRFSATASQTLRTLILAHLGRNEEVSEILERYVVRRPSFGTAEDETAIFMEAAFLEAAVLTGHRHAAEMMVNRFTDTGVLLSGVWYPTIIPRHLGGACALLGRYDEARKYYDEAIKVCMEMRFRPELALTRLQLAELLLEHYPQEKKQAVEHLDFCVKEFRDMKMQPSLERALGHKEIMKA